MDSVQAAGPFKYQYIYGELRSLVIDGRYAPGERLPTEHELATLFQVSRPTVTRALNALQEEGLIERRTGSGSYVRDPSTTERPADQRLLGLLIPGLGKGEIFEPICAQIAKRAEQHAYSLLWSGSEIRTSEAAQSLVSVARRYIDHSVAGVFFEPLELSPSYQAINLEIVSLFREAQIPVVLIDADYLPFPERSDLDLVGIDNFRAAFMATTHYLSRGVQRVDFLARPYSANTVEIRLRGYRAALIEYGIQPRTEWEHWVQPEDTAYIDATFGAGAPSAAPHHILCGNDETASVLMHACDECDIAIPESVRIIGFDDVRYARMLRVPLSTLHQPVAELGDLALETMLWRVEHPTAPARTITLHCPLVIRQSSES